MSDMPSPFLSRRRWLAWLALPALPGLAALLQACSPLALINATLPSASHRRLPDQAYGAHPRHRADVYLPAQPTQGAPVLLFFYGGSWSSGERADYAFVGEALAARGIVTVVADYRLSPEVAYPAFVQDGALALRWVRETAGAWGGSPQRLYLGGHSAGAYNAAMLALDERWLAQVGLTTRDIAGWVGLAGPYDFLPIVLPEARRAFDWPATPADSQPLFHAVAQAPGQRVLLLSGLKDDVVDPRRNTQALARALTARQLEVKLIEYPGLGHVTLIGALARPLRALAPVLDDLTRFLLERPSSG
jgi:acetyl esterase/lipase